MPDPVGILLFVTATFAGSALAAFVVTATDSGKAGVRQFLHNYVQVKVGLGWYVLLLIGYPLLILGALSAASGSLAPIANLVTRWPTVFTAYLPLILSMFIVPALGEEPGWRGFALPRLQQKYGPLAGGRLGYHQPEPHPAPQS